MKILFVCTGNMHRSPLAAAMLRSEIERDARHDLEVLSAGTLDIGGVRAVAEALELATEAGLDLSAHRSTSLSKEMIAEADQILVMEQYHLDWIVTEAPDAAAKCRLLSEFASGHSSLVPGEDLPDAVGEDIASFRRTFAMLLDCVRRYYRELPAPPEDLYTQAIEERFRLRRRTPLTLSPADYELASRWWREGIPLWIVIESIDDLFRRKEHSGDPGRVRRLSWCGRAVNARFAEYQRSHVAPTASAPRTGETQGSVLFATAARRLRTAAENARKRSHEAAAAILETAAGEVESRTGRPPIEPVAARLVLHQLEERILEQLRRCADPAEMKGIRENAESALSAHRERMTAPAFEATLERWVSQRLREIYGLFDLAAP